MRRTLFCAVMVSACLTMVVPAGAAPLSTFSLSDDNSSVSFDLASTTGMYGWVVDTVTHLEKQWFWYRTGAVGDESPISSLTLSNSGATDSNFDSNFDTVYAKYTGTGFTLELRVSLDGGATGTHYSTLAEQVTIKNTSLANLDFHLFQYTDFNLGGTANDDAIQIIGVLPDTIYQSDAMYTGDTVVVQKADYYQAGGAAPLLALFSDGLTTTLGNIAVAGPGSDVAWALQWDGVIKPGKTYQVVIGKTITPEPATLALLGLGGLIAALRRKRG